MKKGCTGTEVKKKPRKELPVLNLSGGETEGIRPSKTSRWRAIALITLNLLMIAHIIQWRFMGETISPIEPSEAMYTIQNGAINAGFIFFALAILATLIFGRFVCGWGCHVVALQDLCAWMLKKVGLKPKPFRSRLLVYVPLIVALYMFVWPTVSRVFAAPETTQPFPGFTNHLITTEFWATFPPVAVAIPFLFICGFMTVYFLGSKGFCTYACPYGGFFSLADKVSPGRIRVTDACNQCGHCTATCTSNVTVHKEVNEHGMVVDPGCMKCMDCISVCPNDALYFGFGKPAVSAAKKTKQNHSLTWPEEITAAVVFFVSFMAVWDVYQLVPMLMALGIASITTFLFLRTWRLLRVDDLSFYRFGLKRSGKISPVGWAFLAFSILWVGLNAHSGWIRYHESAGGKAFVNVRIPDELALAQSNPEQWLSRGDLENVSKGRHHFELASNYGLFVNREAISKRAWMEYLSSDPNKAIELLGEASEKQTGQAKALSSYYRGAILNRLGRYNEAISSLDKALLERPDLILAREEKGETLWQLGRKEEAVSIWKEVVKNNPRLVVANTFLAGFAESNGNTGDAIAYQRQADQFTPADPFFHWMLGLRLKNIGMGAQAERHFDLAIKMNPAFLGRKK